MKITLINRNDMIAYLIKKCLKKHLQVKVKHVEDNNVNRLVTSILWDEKIIYQYVQELK